MKIWIVVGYVIREYENLISAHSTKALAEKQVEELNKKHNDEFDGYIIEELTVDSETA